MRSTTFCVHLGLSDHTIPLSPAHEFQALLGIFHNNLVESLYVDTVLFVLVNQQFLLFSCFRVLFKQICHFLVVKLQEGAVDFDMFPAFLHHLYNNGFHSKCHRQLSSSSSSINQKKNA